MTSKREPEERLRNVSANYHEANRRRESAMAQLQRVIADCDRFGIPKTRIAAIARVSRQTVYDAIRQASDE